MAISPEILVGVGAMIFGIAVALLAMELTKRSRLEQPDAPFMISKAAARQLSADRERAKALRDVIEKIAPLSDAEIGELQAWLDQRTPENHHSAAP